MKASVIRRAVREQKIALVLISLGPAAVWFLSAGSLFDVEWVIGSLSVFAALAIASVLGWHEIPSGAVTVLAVVASSPVSSATMRLALISIAAAGSLALIAFHLRRSPPLSMGVKRTSLTGLLIVAGLLPLVAEQTPGAAAAALFATILAAAILFRLPAQWTLKAGITILIPCIGLMAIGLDETSHRFGMAAFLCLLTGTVLAVNDSEETRAAREVSAF